MSFTALVLSACAAAHHAAPAPVVVDLTGLPPVRMPLVFAEGAREARLTDLLDALAKGTGLEIAADAATQRLLAATIEPLESLQPVPADEAYRFVETILVQNGVTFSRVTPGQRPILTLRSEQSRGETLAPLVVDVERLSEVSAHPALLVRTFLTFENLDARQVQTQLRVLASSPTSVTIPVGERALIVQDTAPAAEALVAMLRTIDASSPAPTPQPQQGSEER